MRWATNIMRQHLQKECFIQVSTCKHKFIDSVLWKFDASVQWRTRFALCASKLIMSKYVTKHIFVVDFRFRAAAGLLVSAFPLLQHMSMIGFGLVSTISEWKMGGRQGGWHSRGLECQLGFPPLPWSLSSNDNNIFVNTKHLRQNSRPQKMNSTVSCFGNNSFFWMTSTVLFQLPHHQNQGCLFCLMSLSMYLQKMTYKC